METEPESSPRDQLVDAPYHQIRCPRCDAYNPKQTRSYRNPQTGASKSYIGPTGCLIPIVVFFAIFVGGYAIDFSLYTILHPYEFSNTATDLVYTFPLCFIPIGSIIAAIIASPPLHRAWRRHRLSKTHITVRHFVCRQCKNEWTVTQEPVSPASHESESAPAVTAPSLPAEGATPAHQTALPAPLLSPPTRGQTKRRRSPADTFSLILLALILLGGISFGIYYVVTRSPFGTTNVLNDVAWSGSQFVVVGDGGTILTSPDGHTWTTQNSGTSNSLSGVAWTGSQFVVVGGNNTNTGITGTILTSPDGHTWTTQNSGTSSDLSGVAWTGSQFVVVGLSGTILTSLDGHTWSTQTSGTTNELNDVAWSGSQFVVVGYGGTILTSLDGYTWTTQTSGTSNYLSGVAWTGSQFVVVGDGGTILTLPDGHTWTTQTSGTSNYLHGVAWTGSQFVVVGDGGTILTSPDGSAWTTQTSGISNNLYGVAWSGSQFVAVGETGIILTSPDGHTWTT